jgi:hypothetical protein
MILDRALQLVLHSACILGAFGGRAVRLPPVRRRVAWSRSVDSAASPFSCCWLKIDRDQKWVHRIARSCRCRAAAQRSDDTLFRTDERAQYRFAEGTSKGGM